MVRFSRLIYERKTIEKWHSLGGLVKVSSVFQFVNRILILFTVFRNDFYFYFRIIYGVFGVKVD